LYNEFNGEGGGNYQSHETPCRKRKLEFDAKAPITIASQARTRLSDLAYVAVDVENNDWMDENFWDTMNPVGRIIEIGWVAYTKDGGVVDEQSHLLRPDGFIISQKAENYHGISTEMALKYGEDPKSVMDMFASALKLIPPMGL
jgi:DNA polymerase III epsilon subunit-like protein